MLLLLLLCCSDSSLSSAVPSSSSLSSPGFDSAYALNKNDAWHVITAYFAEKGLVRQQLDSFDQFIENTMQEVVEESLPIDIYPDSAYNDDTRERERHRFKFGQVYLSAPQMVESDGKIDTMLPNVARTRNLTYCAPLFVEVTLSNEMVADDGSVVRVMKSRSERVFLGRIPIMLHSSFCVLKGKTDKNLTDMKECVYDQGGYFVINGSEKVLIAQERMASNHVYIFSGQKKGSYQAEIRSMAEGCLSEDTQILTEEGFLFVDQVRRRVEGGRSLGVACYSEEGRGLEYRPIRMEDVIDNTGPQHFVHFTSPSHPVDLLVTANHTMYKADTHRSSFRRIEAGDLHKAATSLSTSPDASAFTFLSRAANGLIRSGDEPSLPFVTELGLETDDEVDAFLELYGYGVGESLSSLSTGGVHLDSAKTIEYQHGLLQRLSTALMRGKDEGDDLQHHHTEASYIVRLGRWRAFFDQHQHLHHPLPLNQLPHRHTAALSVSSPPSPTRMQGEWSSSHSNTSDDLSEWTDLDDAEEEGKAVPSTAFAWWVRRRLNARQLRLLIRGLQFAVSPTTCRSEAKRFCDSETICTASPQIRDELLILLLHAGYSAHFTHHSASTSLDAGASPSVTGLPYWRVLYSESEKVTEPVLHGRSDVTISTSSHARVWCVDVPDSSHLILTRRVHEMSVDGSVISASQPVVVGNSSRVNSVMYVKLVTAKKGNMIAGKVMRVAIPYIKKDIPIMIVFRALGFVRDRDILEHICLRLHRRRADGAAQPVAGGGLRHPRPAGGPRLHRQERAPRWGLREEARIKYAQQILTEGVPAARVGVDENSEVKKAYFFGYMIHKLLATVLGRTRLRRQGPLRQQAHGPRGATAARALPTVVLHEGAQGGQAEPGEDGERRASEINVNLAIDQNTITKDLKYALATGNWSANKRGNIKTGVSQVLHRLTFMSTLSHLRRLSTAIARDGKIAKPRQLHNTHWGMVWSAAIQHHTPSTPNHPSSYTEATHTSCGLNSLL